MNTTFQQRVDEIDRQQLADVIAEAVAKAVKNAVTSAKAPEAIRILDVADVAQALGVSRPTIYQWMTAGTFPQPRQLSAGRSGWLIEDVRKYLDTLPRGVAQARRHRTKRGAT